MRFPMKEEEVDKNFVPRENAPVVSMGFRFGVGEELLILDFLEKPGNDITKVNFSAAITKKQAKNLIDGLKQFLDQDTENE